MTLSTNVPKVRPQLGRLGTVEGEWMEEWSPGQKSSRIPMPGRSHLCPEAFSMSASQNQQPTTHERYKGLS